MIDWTTVVQPHRSPGWTDPSESEMVTLTLERRVMRHVHGCVYQCALDASPPWGGVCRIPEMAASPYVEMMAALRATIDG